MYNTKEKEKKVKIYRDHYFLKAKNENYPARSVYKLKELNKKFKLFKKGMKVLDLGAAPGSWSLGAAEYVGPQGLVVACDIQTTETHFPRNVIFHQEDVFNRSAEFEEVLQKYAPFDCVMSDMAPATTGTRFTDQARSFDLCLEAFEVAKKYLKPQGIFICKIFMGPDFQVLAKELKPHFASVRNFKPASSRAESKEIFTVGVDFKRIESIVEEKNDESD